MTRLLSQICEANVVVNLDNDYIVITNPHLHVLAHKVVRNTFSAVVQCTNGTIVFSLDMVTFSLTAGQVLFISNGQLVEFISATSDYKSTILLLSDRFLDNMDLNRRLFFVNQGGCVFVPSSHGSFEKYIGICKDIIKKDTNPEKRDVVRLLTNAYILGLSHFSGKDEQFETLTDASSKIAKHFMSLLRSGKYCAKDTGYYARALNISEKHLYYVVKRCTGHGTSYWINKRIILESKELLSNHDFSIEVVSSKLGFNSQSAFCRFFKNKTGCTPLEYRLKYQFQHQ